MKTGLLIVSMVLAMTGNARAEEGVLQECLDTAKNGALSDMAESERELVEQSYINAVDACLQDHLTPYAGSEEFSDTGDGLDTAERRFSRIDASRRSVGRRSSSTRRFDSNSHSSNQIGKYPRQMHRSVHHGRRAVIPRPRN